MLQKWLVLLLVIGLLSEIISLGFAQEGPDLSQTFTSSEQLTFNYPEGWYVQEISESGMNTIVVSNAQYLLDEDNEADPASGEFLMAMLLPNFINLMMSAPDAPASPTLEAIADYALPLLKEGGEADDIGDRQSMEFGDNRGIVVLASTSELSTSIIFLEVEESLFILLAEAPTGELDQYMDTIYALLTSMYYNSIEGTITLDNFITFTYPSDWVASQAEHYILITNGNRQNLDIKGTHQLGKFVILVIQPGFLISYDQWYFLTEGTEFSTLTHADFVDEADEAAYATGYYDVQFSDVTEITLGGYEAWGMDFTSEAEEHEGVFLLVNVNNTPMLMILTAYSGELADWKTIPEELLVGMTVTTSEVLVLKRIEEVITTGKATLDLEGLGLTTLPPEIGQLTNLQELNLMNNNLTELPPEIGQLMNLRTLRLGYYNCMGDDEECEGSPLTSLPPEIGQLTKLEYLDLHDNTLTSLTPEIGHLTNLQILDLSSNQLIKLPPEIGQLTNLVELELGYNQLSSLPAEIGQLSNLQILDLSNNQLTELPSEIGQLTNLRELQLWTNQLTGLPKELCNLVNLTQFDVSDNPLSSEYIGREIVALMNLCGDRYGIALKRINQAAESGATELNLSGLGLTELPPEIGQLTNLQELDLRVNQLTSLSPEIGQLARLQELDLRANSLTSLPPEIGQLSHLEVLRLNYNRLTELPPEIGQLTNLRELDLISNELTLLPPQLCQLENLEEFNVDDNPLPMEYPTDTNKLLEYLCNP